MGFSLGFIPSRTTLNGRQKWCDEMIATLKTPLEGTGKFGLGRPTFGFYSSAIVIS
jgi:hypothetical protein